MDILIVLFFFALHAAGNPPKFFNSNSLPVKILLHGGSKILLLGLLYSIKLELFGGVFSVLNFAMVVVIPPALCAGNFSKFFKYADLAQSVFLANLFAIGWPLENPGEFFCTFFVPYLASSAILLSVESLKGRDGQTPCTEHFYNLFHGNKIASLALCVAISFLIGVPPLGEVFWRMKFLKTIYNSAQGLSSAIFILCFCSLGCAYFKWLLAAFQRNQAGNEAPNLRARGINFFAAAYALGIVMCKFCH
ncbi:MAG: hypothetical protein LBI81_03610 [Puniceicoccales bacterium]|jgi:NADH:ubiquinone oxidoreductase subunit 2 (subunit N)|nr:hypothetical protein [Puniceicoccales bacterium]